MEDRYKNLADALESEVLTEMAGTFFGARKELDDQAEDLRFTVEALRGQAGKVFARVFFLRSLLLGPEGEAECFAALGLPPQFPEAQSQSGSRAWKPDQLPFALLSSTRFAKTLLLAYAELVHACETYMRGEYEDDPEHKGRKRLSVNFGAVEAMCGALNERIAKLNADMAPSGVLQYARNISTQEQPGQGSITNILGAESLDKGLMYTPVDFGSLNLWRAPQLPAPKDCKAKLTAFAKAFYAAHADKVRRVLDGLRR
ncbi:MAG: hypothetical protein AUJ49_00055 [Desulfovibrionaceae bacterium CG1_02_65_16]|nr:MAG: hypothetical protein AUJ49_00055 [Desulfovibrionaceae bacterium CG1_02_65_16]